MHTVTLIEGDGIGKEVVPAARRCVDALVEIDWDVQYAGKTAEEKTGDLLPEETLDSIRTHGACLKGPVTTPIGEGYRSLNVAIRQKLDLYANVRPAKYFAGVPTRISNPEKIDLVVVRENTEDLYAGIEFMQACGADTELLDVIAEKTGVQLECDTGISIKPISRKASERIIDFAFQYATEKKWEKVAAVDKANIMKVTDGLFMEIAEETAKDHPDIDYEHVLIDALCMQLVQKPESFDVLVMPNLYGDIVSDLCAGLVGGVGFAPSANVGDEAVVFEAVHGTAPDIVGKNIANPAAVILSAAMLLDHLGEEDASKRLERAVATVLKKGEHKTADIAPDDHVSTDAFADAVIAAL